MFQLHARILGMQSDGAGTVEAEVELYWDRTEFHGIGVVCPCCTRADTPKHDDPDGSCQDPASCPACVAECDAEGEERGAL